ncbi:MAG: M24 family metallopeptidase [bacterium]
MTDLIPVSPAERLVQSISTAELERRWKAVRAMMREQSIDYLVMQNQEEYLGGSARWFTDFGARFEYPMTVIFPIDDEMTVINCGQEPPATQPYPPMSVARGIGTSLGEVYFPTMHYTNTIEGKLAVGVLAGKKNPKIGWVQKAFIPVTFYEYVVGNLPGATFVDATEQVDQLRGIKSPEEIEHIKACAVLQDSCIEHLRKTIKPGMRDYEVYAEAQYFCAKNGSAQGIVLVGSGPLGTPVHFEPYRLQNHVIRPGDEVSVLIEVNGPCGYYTEISAIFAVEAEPPRLLEEAFATAKECQDMVAAAMVPGASPGDLWDMAVAFLTERGYARPGRSYAHGQGLSLVERPNIRVDEPWKIAEGMNIAIHPGASGNGVSAGVCEGFIVGKNGAERIHKTPREIIRI